MKKLIPAALALVVLSGCGVAAGPMAAKNRAGAMQAQSAAGVAKGVRAMYKAAFKAADKNANGYLILAEMPPVVPTVGPAGPLPADPAAAAKALFEQLDANKDKKVRWREWLSKATLETATGTFRAEATKAFSSLDKDTNHFLNAEELAAGPVTAEQADANKNGRVTLGEFEDALAAKLAAGPEPVDPPAPPAPAPGGDTPPAPPAPAPGENPQPAPPAPPATAPAQK